MEISYIDQTPANTESNIIETEEEIQPIQIDRTDEILKQLVEVDGKPGKCLKFTRETFKVKKLDDGFKFNSSKFHIKTKDIIEENENLPNEKSFVFLNGDNIGKKCEKILIEKFDTFPICVIGQIQASYKNTNKVILGTGTLVGPNLVITSASNIFRKDLGIFFSFNLNFFK